MVRENWFVAFTFKTQSNIGDNPRENPTAQEEVMQPRVLTRHFCFNAVIVLHIFQNIFYTQKVHLIYQQHDIMTHYPLYYSCGF